MKVGKYHRANINSVHNRVKGKVLVLLRFIGSWHTTTELAELCKFKNNGTMRSHCPVWSKKHIDKHGHLRDGILLRRARGLVGQHRPVWEYTISERGKKWTSWNIDKAGLLSTILKELGLKAKSDIIAPITNRDSQTIDEQMIKKVVNDVIESHKSSAPVPNEAINIVSVDPPVNQPETIDDELVPEEVVQAVSEAWWDNNEFALPGIPFEQLYFTYDDRPSPSDRPGVGPKKRLVLAQRAWELQKQKKHESEGMRVDGQSNRI